MGLLGILQLLPVLISMAEQFLPGVAGSSKLALVFKILKVVLQYPAKILKDISAGNWEQLVTDIAAIMVEAAHANNVFVRTAGTQTPAPATLPIAAVETAA